MASVINVLKRLQIATAVGVLLQMWMMYPGVMVLFASFAGLAYLATAICAIYDLRFFMWISALVTVAVWAWTSTIVVVIIDRGFNYLSGTYASGEGGHILLYVFLLNALMSLSVVTLTALSWRWFLFGEQDSQIAGE